MLRLSDADNASEDRRLARADGDWLHESGRIPVPVSAIIGRLREIDVITGMLLDDGIRLVVLTGPGGVGKTRLSIDIASALHGEFADGVYFVPLATVTDPALVVPTIARHLGFWADSQPTVQRRLERMLADLEVLIVLDNFEQVVEAAPRLVSLLAACPRLTLLVTSRTVLRVSGEHDIPLAPLSARRTSDDDAEPAAVRLFAERARAVSASFQLTSANLDDVRAICERLDGLPLAIELAAARSAHLSPHALLPRLDRQLPILVHGPRDAPARLQTMRNAIGWSYDLLSAEQQALFRCLSVFVGGFTLDAMRAVALPTGGDPATDEWFDVDALASLMDQSLVFTREAPDGESRYAMLEMIREYGLEQLDATGEADTVRSRHADWCIAFARGIDAVHERQSDARWRDQLEAGLANYRAASGWLAATGDYRRLLDLAIALYPLWYYLGHAPEGIDWLTRGLPHADTVPPEVVLRATLMAADMIGDQTNQAQAVQLANDAAMIARELGDMAALARALYTSGKFLQLSGSVAEGRARIEESLLLFEAHGDEIEIAHTHTYLAMLGPGEGSHGLSDQGQLARARACWEEELRIAREGANVILASRAIHGLAYVAHLAGDDARALVLSQQALRRRYRIGDVRNFPPGFEDIADIANATGQFERGARLYGAASRLRERLDIPIPWWFREEFEREIGISRDGLSIEAFDAAWSAGREMTTDEAVAEALAVSITPPPPTERGAAAPSRRASRIRSALSERELEVLRLLVDGHSNARIATDLYISRKTVANHVSSILSKLGVESRTAAVSYALRQNLHTGD